MSNNNDIGAFLAGFVIGGLVGAAAALILAPQSGSQTRSTLSDQTAQWRSVGAERLAEARERAAEMTHPYVEKAKETGEQLQERSREIVDAGKKRIEQVTHQMQESTGG